MGQRESKDISNGERGSCLTSSGRGKSENLVKRT